MSLTHMLSSGENVGNVRKEMDWLPTSGEIEDITRVPANEILLPFSSSQLLLLSVYLMLEWSSLLARYQMNMSLIQAATQY